MQKCNYCKENIATSNVHLDGELKPICDVCLKAMGGKPGKSDLTEKLLNKLKEKQLKLDKKLTDNLKKMSDKDLIAEHNELAKVLNEPILSYFNEINKEITKRGLQNQLNGLTFEKFNEPPTQAEFQEYLSNNNYPKGYSFENYKSDIWKLREKVIEAGNKIMEGLNHGVICNN